ncbi:MAG: O-methyltransferase [Bacteroidetes bacterium]|nr:O-methyltransferase [Bacteroidota bacterium]MCL2303130.1 O-methyltransferase [Lentimicrobiaceae bacterium]
MYTLTNEQIESYCEAHTSNESDLLYRLNRETHLKILRPRMLSGHLQGRFLAMISKMIKPVNILEIGTFTGYSALCLAEGLQPNGALHTIEIDEELEEIIIKYFNLSAYKDKLHLHIGNALKIIPTLNKTWDLVFMDAEKTEYLQYYEMVLSYVKKGGFILIDNVLWNGKVTEPVAENDVETKAITAFNDFVQNDSRVNNVLLPLRDGLMLIEKL